MDQVQTRIDIGASDITALMVQVHIDALIAADKALEAEQQVILAEARMILQTINERFATAFAAVKPRVDALVDMLNALRPADTSIYAAEFRIMDVGTRLDGIFNRIRNRESSWLNHDQWVLSWFLIRPERASTSVINEHHLLQDVRHLVIPADTALRDQMDALVERHTEILGRREDLASEIEDIPAIERRVRAAFTRKLLMKQPEIMDQIRMALNEMVGTLTIGVQD